MIQCKNKRPTAEGEGTEGFAMRFANIFTMSVHGHGNGMAWIYFYVDACWINVYLQITDFNRISAPTHA